MSDLTLLRWHALRRIATRHDCVPLAMAMVENMSYTTAKARCEFFQPSTSGYRRSTMEYALNRRLRPVSTRPIKGYAWWNGHVSPVLGRRIYGLGSGTPEFLV